MIKLRWAKTYYKENARTDRAGAKPRKVITSRLELQIFRKGEWKPFPIPIVAINKPKDVK